MGAGAGMGGVMRPIRSAAGILAAVLAGAIGLIAPGAHAQGFVAERTFPVAGACYLRRYEAAHLARHPGQVVTGLRIWGDARSLVALRREAPRIDPELALTIRIDFADGGRAQGAVGCSEAGGRIRRCGRNADCAGDVAVDLLPDGRLRIVNDGTAPREPGDAPGFSPDAVCRAVADPVRPGRFVPPDAQNRVFLLERQPLAACADADHRKELP